MKVNEINASPYVINAFLRVCGEDNNVEDVFKDWGISRFLKLPKLGRKGAVQAYCIIQSIIKGKDRQLPTCFIDFRDANAPTGMLKKTKTQMNTSELCKDIELLIKEKYNQDVIVFDSGGIDRSRNVNR